MKPVRKDIEDIIALTPMQEGMLFHYLQDPGNDYYFEQLTLDISGEIDIDIFEKAWNFVIETNEMLRTMFRWQDMANPVQIILKEHHIRPGYYDFSGKAPGEKKKRLETVLFNDRAKKFDLRKTEVPFRINLCKLKKDEYRVIISYHHILYDGWSTGIILKEFLTAYDDLSKGRDPVKPVKTRFKEFIHWVHHQDIEKQEKYWRSYLDGFDTFTGFSIKRKKAAQINNNKTYRWKWGRGKTNELMDFLKKHKLTFASLLYSAWGILLQRYKNCDDVIFGTTVSGRPSAVDGIEDIVGLFINTIPLRVRTTGNDHEKVKDFLSLLNKEIRERERYESASLVEIKKYGELGFNEELFDTIVVIENYPLGKALFEGYGNLPLSVDAYSMFEKTHYDLTVGITLIEDIEVEFTYNENLFDDSIIKKLPCHFVKIVEDMVNNPGKELAALEILSETEKNKILFEFNNTATDYTQDKTIHQLFAGQVELIPDHIALVGSKEEGWEGRKVEVHLSYNELNKISCQLAYILKEKGVGHDVIVALMVKRSLEMVVGIFGILKAGGAYLPIDPDYPEERIDYMLKDSGTNLLVTTDTLTMGGEKLRRYEGKKNLPIVLLDFSTFLTFYPSILPSSHLPPEPVTSLAYLIYTSGSTGKPKGVMVEHRAVVNRLYWVMKRYAIHHRDVILQATSFTFDVSVCELFRWIPAGGKLCLLAPGGEKDPVKIVNTIEKNRVTTADFVPTLLAVLLDYLVHQDSVKKVSSLRWVFTGAETVSIELVKTFNNILYKTNHTHLINAYGPTESTVDVTYLDCSHWQYSGDSDLVYEVPIGKPMDNVRLYILDKNKRPQPLGIVGELCIAGKGLARGYLNNPGLTAERFFFFHSSYMSSMFYIYKTGDLARWLEDGNIEFQGRMDNQVKIRGHRVELGEIEAHLQAHPQVKDALVTAKKSPDGDKYLCVYVKAAAGEPLTVPGLRAHLGKQLPWYMIPSYFVILEQFPLTSNGKVDLNALPDPHEPDNDSYAAPGNPVEEKLVEVWESILGRRPIGIHDNFFTIGGDSIKAIQIISRMSKAQYRVEMKDIFQHPMISELAPHVTPLQKDSIAPQSEVIGVFPLSPIQESFFHGSRIDAHHYNQAVLLYAPERLEEKMARKLFAAIQTHHDALRMTYKEENGQVVQTNHGLDYPLSVEIFDLRKQENAVEQLEMKANEIQAGIDLEKGPLMKLGLFHLDDGDRLLIVVHHLVIDGMSWRILFEDLETLYRQYKQGIPLVLPPKTTSFKEWSTRLKEYANSDLFLREKAYWENLEAEPIPVIVKDAHPERSHIKDKKTLSFRLSKRDSECLLTRVNEAFFTEINDILLTALILSLDSAVLTTGGDTDSSKFMIAVEGHGRADILPGVDTSRTVGWFTCVFPVILEVFPLANLARQIKEIKEQLRRVPNKGIGYGILKYLTAPEKKGGIDFQLKPQVSFNYLGQFDADVEQAFFAIAPESVDWVESPKRPLEFEIDIYGMITRKQLEMSVTFSKNQYKISTIEKFLQHFQQELRRIIHYCASREVREQTPADFTYKHLPIDALESIMRCIKGNIQDIYPLSPMQEGMFFHAQYQPTAITNFEQTSYRVHGKLDTAVIEKSLNELFRRHEMLRAVFIHKGLDRPVQVILKERSVDFEYEDVRERLKAGKIDKQEYLRTFKEKDLRRGFDLSKDVLMRVSILQWDDEEYEFTWSNHHILMDGWCTGILLMEYTEIYNSFIQSKVNRLPPLVPYRYYLQWLERQDKQESGRYWASYLQGYKEIARIPEKQETNSGEGYKSEELYFSLSRQETAGMNRLAEKNRLTLNTVMQTIWGILLGRYNGKEDVVFGAVVSGRPAEIPGVESIVGVFMNTVPVRICFKDTETLTQLLHRVQKNAIESEPHHYYPLAEIQAGNILKQDLLDHILVFENYPIAAQIEDALGRQEQKSGEEKNSPEISNVKVFGQSNYDFNVTIIPGEEIMIRFDYNAHAYPGDFIAVAAKDFKELFQQAAINNNQEILVKEITIPHDLAEINTVSLVSEQGDFEF